MPSRRLQGGDSAAGQHGSRRLQQQRQAAATATAGLTESSGHLFLRDTSCLTAVRKPWGLKKPLIQKLLGRPVLSQRCSCSWRARRPANQLPLPLASQLQAVEARTALTP